MVSAVKRKTSLILDAEAFESASKPGSNVSGAAGTALIDAVAEA